MSALDAVLVGGQLGVRWLQSLVSTSIVSNGEPLDGLDAEKFREVGYVVVEGFLKDDTCQKIVEEVFGNNFQPTWVDKINSDKRAIGVEDSFPSAREFHQSTDISSFISAATRRKYSCQFTMAGHLSFQTENEGSGGGWHRDSIANQPKALIYLSDANVENGPFEYLAGSHKTCRKISDAYQGLTVFGHNRISNSQASKLIEQKYECHTLTGKAGTLVIFDATGIHRGRPIKAGERFALTNYYYLAHHKNMQTHFS